jgi:hypothetical protein
MGISAWIIASLTACSTPELPFPTCQDDPRNFTPAETTTWTDGLGTLILKECAVCHDG